MAEPILSQRAILPVLTIGGSDSGGAAGLQADLKTFAALGVYGMSVVTVVTAQNSVAVSAVHPLPAAFVDAQLEAVLSDYGAAAVKTGFIGSTDVVQVIGRVLGGYAQVPLVVDPVLVNHRGEAMFSDDVVEAYRHHLLPQADLVTPNRREAELLAGVPLNNLGEMATAAGDIHRLGAAAVLITGFRDGNDMVDLLFDGRESQTLHAPWIETSNTHGSGDTLSAAIATFLAQGMPMPEAVAQARRFTHAAIAAAVAWRLGAGHGPVNHWATAR
jgi:hydroxymethylpyrimidine kinase/phosphomethylpyrimidine kinase